MQYFNNPWRDSLIHLLHRHSYRADCKFTALHNSSLNPYHQQACVTDNITLLFIAAHNLYYISLIGTVLRMPSLLNIFQLMNHNPRRTVIHFIHANFWVFLDPSLQTPPFFFDCCRMGDTSAIQVRTQHNYHWFTHHKSRAERDRLLWNVACQYTVREAGLMAHSSVASASCCLHQLLFDRKGFFPQCFKDTAINLRGLTATHYGAVFLLYYNRYYRWSICKWHNTKQQQQII